MAKNPVQFQKGLSLDEFIQDYGTEEQCLSYLEEMKWPNGFECECGCKESFVLKKPRKLHQCKSCRKQTSITSGTIFHGTKLPLRKWLLAIYFMTQSKNGISQLELSRQLGVHINTAALLYHKLAHVMMEREDSKKLSGDNIEIDDAYWGGKKKGKRGRGSENKTPFIAAVSKIEGKPSQMKLSVVSRFSKAEISKWGSKFLERGTTVISDGLNCFPALADDAVGCIHRAIVVGDSKDPEKTAFFNWVNTILGNLKTALAGTFHKLAPNYVKRHLATFAYRFNRRFKLEDMIPRLTYVAVRTLPMPKKLLTRA